MNNIKQAKNSKIGWGIILGVSLGFIIGLLFLDGNIAFGISIGVTLGIVLGSIADARNSTIQQKDYKSPETPGVSQE